MSKSKSGIQQGRCSWMFLCVFY